MAESFRRKVDKGKGRENPSNSTDQGVQSPSPEGKETEWPALASLVDLFTRESGPTRALQHSTRMEPFPLGIYSDNPISGGKSGLEGASNAPATRASPSNKAYQRIQKSSPNGKRTEGRPMTIADLNYSPNSGSIRASQQPTSSYRFLRPGNESESERKESKIESTRPMNVAAGHRTQPSSNTPGSHTSRSSPGPSRTHSGSDGAVNRGKAGGDGSNAPAVPSVPITLRQNGEGVQPPLQMVARYARLAHISITTHDIFKEPRSPQSFTVVIPMVHISSNSSSYQDLRTVIIATLNSGHFAATKLAAPFDDRWDSCRIFVRWSPDARSDARLPDSLISNDFEAYWALSMMGNRAWQDHFFVMCTIGNRKIDPELAELRSQLQQMNQRDGVTEEKEGGDETAEMSEEDRDGGDKEGDPEAQTTKKPRRRSRKKKGKQPSEAEEGSGEGDQEMRSPVDGAQKTPKNLSDLDNTAVEPDEFGEVYAVLSQLLADIDSRRTESMHKGVSNPVVPGRSDSTVTTPQGLLQIADVGSVLGKNAKKGLAGRRA